MMAYAARPTARMAIEEKRKTSTAPSIAPTNTSGLFRLMTPVNDGM